MIVCHCTGITDREIRAAVEWMRAADPATIITPGKVYRALGRKAECGSCLPVFIDTMSRCDSFRLPMDAHSTAGAETQEARNEGQR